MYLARFYRMILAAAGVLFLGIFAYGQDKAPAWLTQAAQAATPVYDIQDVPAVQLLNEETVSVSPDGTYLRTIRRAVRVLEKTGKEEAIARVVYQTDSDKVRDLDAWLIKKSGTVKDFGKKETLDISLTDNDLYNEARVKLISAEDESDIGDVFGFEAVLEEKTIFSQFRFPFQYDIPTLVSRFSLTMPPGWRAESVIFNAPDFKPSINGTVYLWEMRDLKPVRPEPQSPRWTSLVPRLAVSVFPDQTAASRLKTFSNWNEVAKWMAEIEDPQMTVNDALAAKAQDLTASAKTELDKIRAISRYVQQIQYISIQIGSGRGGGYVPKSATDVFSKSYGDCKDKANLMRAMLSVLKINAYLVSITADDPDYVQTEWASPHQFNHCIIAIKISDSTVADTVVTHPTLGRLLIFDPTDPYTPLGDLPEDEQGSLALIDHKDTAALMRMPVLPAEMNRIDRDIEASISPAGSMTGTVIERNYGQSARRERARMKTLSADDYTKVIDRWISRGVSGARTSKIAPTDKHEDGKFDLQVDFSAASYGQIMQDRLMVFKPAVVGRLDRLSFGDGMRTHPYMIDASSYKENVRIKLPEGFDVDELPDAVKLNAEFGTYDVACSVEQRELLCKRSLTLKRSKIPAEKFADVMAFFGKIRKAEEAPVVLLRK